MDDNTSYEYMKFWKRATPEEQEEKFEIFIELLKKFKEEDYYLVTLFNNSDKNVIQKHNSELAKLISENQEDILMIKHIWKFLSVENQKECEQILRNTIDNLIVQGKDISKIWEYTNKQTQTEMVNELLNKYEDKQVSIQILRGLNIELSQEYFGAFLEKNEVQIGNIKQKYEIYQNIFRVNKNVNNTIELSMFNDRILNNFSLEKLVRLTTYPEIQKEIVSLSNIEGFCDIIKSINDENWIMELDSILKNANNFPELLENIPKEPINEESAQMIAEVFSQRENYFNISNIWEAKNYFKIRRDICKNILNDEENENLNTILKSYPIVEERKRFAILEMMYGIDIEDARNLIEKYGKDVEKIDTKKYGKTILALRGIKSILECDNISEIYNSNKEIIDNELEEIEYSNIVNLETKCINMYAQTYKETLYHPQEADKIDIVQYEGKEINVYEINQDFNMFVRAEGACNGYEEPKNFAEKLATPSTKYHGNCKSFIGQDSICIANSEGVKYGYSECKENSLLMCAPWDIMSNGANAEFSTASEKWNTNVRNTI
ncbi:MAG: hypothetical protein HFJ42_05925 [Clostridia bacterium]|nr:hypothetical protein [Clostridia bacterium]